MQLVITLDIQTPADASDDIDTQRLVAEQAVKGADQQTVLQTLTKAVAYGLPEGSRVYVDSIVVPAGNLYGKLADSQWPKAVAK